MNSKIQRDLSELVQANVISTEVSQNISDYYNSKTIKSAGAPNKLFAIFGVLGSLLIGLGIILILAHNWDDFSRATKTIWAFAPLVIGQAFAAYSLFKKKSAAWKESAATFLYLAIGASMSLVSQVYNIPGSMPSFLLTWILLAAPLIYLLRSHAANMLHLVFITSYACNLGYFNDASPWLYLPLLFWVAPYYYRQIKSAPTHNTTGLLHWLMPVSLLVSMGAFLVGNDHLGFLMYLFLFGLLYNIGKLPFFKDKKLRANGYALLGSLGTIVVLLTASFSWFWTEFRLIFGGGQETWITLFLGMATLGILGYLFQKKELRAFNLFQYAFIIFGFIYAINFEDVYIPLILTNMLVLALGIFTVYMGAKKNRYSILNYGLLIITTLITCRFFDTDFSFVIRGLLFVAIGAGFFMANYLMYKKQQKQLAHE